MFGEASLLGFVQGLTEFIPVSSSAHLVLIPYFTGWQSSLLKSVTFDVALHLGTLLAVLAYFRREWVGAWQGLGIWVTTRGQTMHADLRLMLLVALATLPILIAGVVLHTWVEGIFRSPLIIASTLMLVGLVMGLVDRYAQPSKTISGLTWNEALLLGVAQCAALAPGVSRSGPLLIAGLLLGYNR